MNRPTSPIPPPKVDPVKGSTGGVGLGGPKWTPPGAEGTYLFQPLLGLPGSWLNFRLWAGFGMDGRKISMAWNGQRLALGKELARAAAKFPCELESVTEWLEAGQP